MNITVNKEDKNFYFEEFECGEVFKVGEYYYMKVPKIWVKTTNILDTEIYYNAVRLVDAFFVYFSNKEVCRKVQSELIINE